MYIALILAVGLSPAILLVLASVYAHWQEQPSTDTAASYANPERFRRFRTRYSPEAHFVEGKGFVVGDITCELNALSPYIRCAANPTGPCDGCQEYESKAFEPI